MNASTARSQASPSRDRRQSIPGPTPSSAAHQPTRAEKPAKDRSRREPASPAVISSLISSLSAVSLPANARFDDRTLHNRASWSPPASPNTLRTTFGAQGYRRRRSSATPSMTRATRHHHHPPDSDGDSFHDSVEYVGTDDSAAPPVIRTSKPSSASYPPRHSPSNNGEGTPSWRKYLRGPSDAPAVERDPPSPSFDVPDRRRGSAASTESGRLLRRTFHHLVNKESGERSKRAETEPDQVAPVAGPRSVSRPNRELAPRRRDGRSSSSSGTHRPMTGTMFDEKFFDFNPSKSKSARRIDVGLHPNHPAGPPSGSGPTVDSAALPSDLVPDRYASLRKGGGHGGQLDRPLEVRVDGAEGNQKPLGRSSVHGQERNRGRDAQVVAPSDHPVGSKRKKAPPKLTGMTKLSTKMRSPIGSPTIVLPSPAVTTTPLVAATTTTTTTVEVKNEHRHRPGSRGEGGSRIASEDDSAPSPAIMRRRARDGNNHVKARSRLSPSVSPSGDRPSQEGERTSRSSASDRRRSRLRRRSQPVDHKSAQPHHRTFSIPLGRNSTSSRSPARVRTARIMVEGRPSTADSIEDAVDAYLCSPRLSQKIRHPDSGRVISFSEVGDSEGFAVFCCVGMGLTRYIMAFYDELALTLKLRLITPDRPGVGDSESHVDGTGTPLGWPDDVHAICQALKITKFSILAHSAGAIYALAIALRMPQHVRGRIHLLAPWIPPSQLSVIGSQQEIPPAGAVPTSQRILRALPTSIFKVANSSFMNATSSSLTSSLPKSSRRKRKSNAGGNGGRKSSESSAVKDEEKEGRYGSRDSLTYPRPRLPGEEKDASGGSEMIEVPDLAGNGTATTAATTTSGAAPAVMDSERQVTFDNRLAHAIWDLATTGANPAVDLLVCLERRQPIGFRYVDITRTVVIHHGSRDTRVPVENVRWLGKKMRQCEVRVLNGEGHGLMASGVVMGSVLMEMAKEWEDWTTVVQKARNTNGLFGGPISTIDSTTVATTTDG